MRSEPFVGAGGQFRAGTTLARIPRAARQGVVTALLIVAMLAFELFNFDTTRFALHNLLGDVSFSGVRWAAILALAFCAIDFAGLAHLCAPESEREAGPGTWYLMGAWLLGAMMNALMTWWAITLTLLNHSLGNEVLSRAQILEIVPLFVAGLVWLTRILFIGAFAINADRSAEYEGDVWSWQAPQHQPGLSGPGQPALPGDRQAQHPLLPTVLSARGRRR